MNISCIEFDRASDIHILVSEIQKYLLLYKFKSAGSTYLTTIVGDTSRYIVCGCDL